MLRKTTDLQLQHLLHRTGFGASPADVALLSRLPYEKAVDKLFKRSEAIDEIKLLEWRSRKDERMKNASPERRKQLRKQRKEEGLQLNTHWLSKMSSSDAQLREKMTLFWHDHFAAHVQHPYALQHLNNVMRRHALGDFKVLLMEVSKHPVMLEYLNNRQNRKASPNENFAREVMELFTLGRGNYTEMDVKEAARAFTGWNFDQEGQFIFRKNQHDDGPKVFRGKTGHFKGEDIVSMLLEDKQTARYLAGKLYRYLVHPESHPERIEGIATAFFDSGYDISVALRHILLAPWFLDGQNIGVRIKSPAEYLAGMFRTLNVRVQNPEVLVQVQKILGQVLFKPPNVAGWPEGRAWIDSSTLMARMTIPAAILLAADTDLRAQTDLMDVEGDRNQLRRLKKIQAEVDWRPLFKHLNAIDSKDTLASASQFLLQVQPSNLEPLRRLSAGWQGAEAHKAVVSQIVSLPEYQLA